MGNRAEQRSERPRRRRRSSLIRGRRHLAFACLALGTSQQFPFGGTSILIVVGVGLDTVKQIQSQLQQRNYEGLLM